MRTPALLVIQCSLVAAFLAVSASASATGDVHSGAVRSVACQACHGGDGISISPDIPNLAGQKAEYLTQQLKAFRSGDRKHDVMNPIARQLSDADIANLVAFWNSLPSAGTKKDAAPAALLARQSVMTFPADFPKGFTVYRTQEDVAQHNVGISYANDIALKAARGGTALPSGSIIVVVNMPVKLDANQKPVLDAKGHMTPEGAPRSYSAMEARAGWGRDLPELLRNGEWSYALFNAQQKRADKFNYAMCFACHKSVEADSFVFTLKQLVAKAKES
jgi:cytochrome c553